MSKNIDFSKVRLDVKQIVDDLCGAKEPTALTQKKKIELLVKRMNAAGFTPIQTRGIEKWVDKNMVSGDRMNDLSNLAAMNGIRFNQYKYMINENGDRLYPGEK